MTEGLHAGGLLSVLGEDNQDLGKLCGSRVSEARNRKDFSI